MSKKLYLQYFKYCPNCKIKTIKITHKFDNLKSINYSCKKCSFISFREFCHDKFKINYSYDRYASNLIFKSFFDLKSKFFFIKQIRYKDTVYEIKTLNEGFKLLDKLKENEIFL